MSEMPVVSVSSLRSVTQQLSRPSVDRSLMAEQEDDSDRFFDTIIEPEPSVKGGTSDDSPEFSFTV